MAINSKESKVKDSKKKETKRKVLKKGKTGIIAYKGVNVIFANEDFNTLKDKKYVRYNFYLNVISSFGVFHIPLTYEDENQFIFNWIFFGEPVKVFSVQLKADVIRYNQPKDSIDIKTISLTAPQEKLASCDFFGPYEAGCFVVSKSALDKNKKVNFLNDDKKFICFETIL